MADAFSVLMSFGSGIWLVALATAVIAYFCGCFNGAVIVSKYILRDDVRNHGSGNAGLTNFFRTFGGPLTFVVILTDVLKAVVAIRVCVWLSGQLLPLGSMDVYLAVTALSKYWAGLWCLLGGGQLPLRHLVCLPRPPHYRPGGLHRTSHFVYAPGQHPPADYGNGKQVQSA